MSQKATPALALLAPQETPDPPLRRLRQLIARPPSGPNIIKNGYFAIVVVISLHFAINMIVASIASSTLPAVFVAGHIR